MKITRSMQIGIIGGKGRTGAQFAMFFRKLGFHVAICDKRTRLRPRDLFARCDIVLFAVPLQDSTRIMKKEVVHTTRRDQLIVDVSSLKTAQVEAMLGARGEVIGMHPMFGPKTQALGETVILTPGRCKRDTLRSLQTLLGKMGLKTVVMTPGEHDQLMTFVQALPHLKSLLIAGALQTLGADLGMMDKVTPPPYELELNMVGRFLDDNPLLYGPIIFGNPRSLEVIKTLQTLLGEYAKICEQQDYTRFRSLYHELQRSFSSRRTALARTRSEACIRTLAHLRRR